MTATAPDGAFHLGPGVRLCPGKDESGVLIQTDPLRAIRVNPSARRLLDRCRNGLPASLLVLDYPETRREIIVVDDGSTDDTVEKIRDCPVRLLRLPQNEGQSAARNHAVDAARGDIIAFINSDCIADPKWLTESTPYFQDGRVALVGGYVDSYYNRTRLDRFESVDSSLNMGDETLIGAGDRSVLYVPTCNMLVRRSAYEAVGGLDAALRVGEDVDLCWRVLGAGHRLMYVPKGQVKHKHRNRFWPGFLRRFDYGASEPALYAAHPRAAKRFPWQTGGLLFLASVGLGFVYNPWLFFPVAGAVLSVEAATRQQGMDRACGGAKPLGFGEILRATARSHLLLAFYLSHHIIRYHLLPLLLLMVFLPRLAPLLTALIVFPTVVGYLRKRPRTDPLSYGFFFIMEQLFYGAGVLWGSIRLRHLKCYRLAFANAGFLKKSPLNFRSWLRPWTGIAKWTPFRSNTKI